MPNQWSGMQMGMFWQTRVCLVWSMSAPRKGGTELVTRPAAYVGADGKEEAQRQDTGPQHRLDALEGQLRVRSERNPSKPKEIDRSWHGAGLDPCSGSSPDTLGKPYTDEQLIRHQTNLENSKLTYPIHSDCRPGSLTPDCRTASIGAWRGGKCRR